MDAAGAVEVGGRESVVVNREGGYGRGELEGVEGSAVSGVPELHGLVLAAGGDYRVADDSDG